MPDELENKLIHGDNEPTFTATYSPDDNKLRLYASSRLDPELYARVKAAGFKWAPKQDLFVAPTWTPSREDLLIELCGEIGDEDTSLIERAEERADRFENYSDKRMADAERARKAVDSIAENIPFGQPILIGHHSERHARRDAEKIENGMRKAVKMWDTSKYWTSRAAGAITAPNMYDRSRSITYRQVEMTKAEYARIDVDYKGTRLSTDKGHRFRTAMIRHELVCVFLTDLKAVDEPKAGEAPAAPERAPIARPSPKAETPKPAQESDFEAMRASVKAGVQVVSAPQLFPTPPDLAARMVDLADIGENQDILEPSAGTGRIVRAIRDRTDLVGAELVAVEIKPNLADLLRTAYRVPTHCADFLDCSPGRLGSFDRILMNPPFKNADDIRHIEHARSMLKPGGRIVAICANGPRQRERLKPIAAEWHDLPAGSFKDSGTDVNAALLVIEATP